MKLLALLWLWLAAGAIAATQVKLLKYDYTSSVLSGSITASICIYTLTSTRACSLLTLCCRSKTLPMKRR